MSRSESPFSVPFSCFRYFSKDGFCGILNCKRRFVWTGTAQAEILRFISPCGYMRLFLVKTIKVVFAAFFRRNSWVIL